tara:strand:+ start:1094 stop:1435 length:342 start_codon:yes stop_codon:yes gene_type:complete
MYEYTAKITSVYDGDTVTGDVDLGFGIWIKKQKFRLMGIDTPEIRTKDKDEKVRGYEARDRLRELILGKTVRIRSFGKGKYGRWLVDIWIEDMDTRSVNQLLILEGHADHYII